MKTRTSFVSNSSTCSFVILGIELDRTDPISRYFNSDQYDEDREDRPDLFNGFDIVHDDGRGIIIGAMIAETECNDYMPDREYDLASLVAKAEAVKARFHLDGEIRIYAGTRSC